MPYNLIHKQWIPVCDASGAVKHIAPHEITAEPWVRLAAPRPDFNGALAQFLIGLLQTACTPPTESVWKKWFDTPPSPEELKRYFTQDIGENNTLDNAFYLDGDGPRFMQDLEPFSDKKPHKISWLLIDSPGKSTEEKNRDHFIKRDLVTGMCMSCAATGLFTLQLNASEGGRGHLTGMRGGGPLTTLIKGDNLWHTLWLNVLSKLDFPGLGSAGGKEKAKDIYPWLAQTRTSENELMTTPADAHPYQMYWSMPRRIRLAIDSIEDGSCDLCGRHSRLVKGFYDKTYGVRYSPSREQAKKGIKIRWQHCLTPYVITTPQDGIKELSPLHPQPGGVTYRHWLGLVENVGHMTNTGSSDQEPARVVFNFRDHRKQLASQLWAFGYDMDSDNPRCWYEADMPLVEVGVTLKPAFLESVKNALEAADYTRNAMRDALKRSWYGKPDVKEVKGRPQIQWKFPESVSTDTTVFYAIGATFWQCTESVFYDFLAALKTNLEAGGTRETAHPVWYDTLRKEAIRLFDETVESAELEGDLKSRVFARKGLVDTLNSSKLKNDILRLSVIKGVQP